MGGFFFFGTATAVAAAAGEGGGFASKAAPPEGDEGFGFADVEGRLPAGLEGGEEEGLLGVPRREEEEEVEPLPALPRAPPPAERRPAADAPTRRIVN